MNLFTYTPTIAPLLPIKINVVRVGYPKPPEMAAPKGFARWRESGLGYERSESAAYNQTEPPNALPHLRFWQNYGEQAASWWWLSAIASAAADSG